MQNKPIVLAGVALAGALILIIGVAALRNGAAVTYAPGNASSDARLAGPRPGADNAQVSDAQYQAAIVINDVPVSAQQLAGVGIQGLPGNWWYDSFSGAYGLRGGPAIGLVAPGLSIGMLRQDASNGDTGVIVNGRELTRAEVTFLLRYVPYVLRGRWWMTNQGVFGAEGNPTPMGQIQFGGGGGRPGRSLSERGMLFSPYDYSGIAAD
jgi:hypothetical protein